MRKIPVLAALVSLSVAFVAQACSSNDNGSQGSDDASTGSEAGPSDDSGITIGIDVVQLGSPDSGAIGDDSSIPQTGDDDDDAGETGDDDASDGATAIDASDGGGSQSVDASDGGGSQGVDASDGAAPVDAGDDGSSDDASDGAPPVDAGPVPTVFVLRVGDGTTTLSNASVPVFLDEYPLTAGASPVRSIALPTAASGNNNPIVLSGTATSEGQLELSGDGHYVTFAGYAAATGIAAISSSQSSPLADGGASYVRVVARIDSTGAVDTSTLLPLGAFSGNNVRSAVSSDGTSFWVAGTGDPGGVLYAADGVSDAGTQIVTTPSNARVVSIISGQLYLSSGSSPFVGISSVGSGLPTTAVTPTLLPGFLADAGGSDAAVVAPVSPYAFVAFDTDSTLGIDTLYIADDPSSGGGLQKWTFDGATWTKASETTVGAKAIIGLTGFMAAGSITLVATTTENPARLISLVDDGVSTPVVIASSPAKTFFRGVALSPLPL